MSDSETLYRELRDDFEALTAPLFDFAQQQVRKRGAFLPFGASLSTTGEVSLHAGSARGDFASSEEHLPAVHDDLRGRAARADVTALAVCEWVKVTFERGRPTDAVKVLVEHSRGLVIGFYLPSRRRLLGGWSFGEVVALPVAAEIQAWREG